jgi:NADH-quinone oxidoreductase subunit J
LTTEEIVAAAEQPAPAGVTNVEALGDLFYTDYFYLFQAAGLILLISIIGAITLTLRQRPRVRRQRIAEQVHRPEQATVELRKVQPGSGV